MKTHLSAADIRFLTYELNKELPPSRIEKAYQIGDRELKLKIHSQKKGALELVITANYFCTTNYPRKTPEQPTPFAMQLRKHLSGAYIKEIRQHEFDRIIEITIEAKEKKYVLIAELFSKGNIILCDEKNKILGLLEWQKWRDRKLGVGQTYEYPPKTPNPLEINKEKLLEILNKTNKKTAAALATEAGLGGLLAEETCLLSGIEKDKEANKLSDEEKKKLAEAFTQITEAIREPKINAATIIEDNKLVDVTPIDLHIYKNNEKKNYSSFNEAVDEYFSRHENEYREKEASERYQKEKNKLLEIKRSQEEHHTTLLKESIKSKETGDLIYQNYPQLESILKKIKEDREKGLSWEELQKKYGGKEVDGILIEEIKDNIATVIINTKKI